MSRTAAIGVSPIPEREGIKETLESIIVALILAFVFRAFIVEAFVIPTGSMAPTLYGAHGTIICEDCGIEFGYGLRDLAETRRTQQVRGASNATCPNCNHPNSNLAVNDERRNTEKGDRILVLKWPFDLGGSLLDPARWDVIVFKNPADGVQNYIKRTIGLPNEVLMIVNGDIYTVPTSELSEETLDTLDAIRHEKYELREEIRRGKLRAVPSEVLAELDEKMTIPRKTPTAQKSLWFRAFDQDYPPRKLDRNQPRWAPARGSASGWDATGRRVQFEDRGVAKDFIQLDGKPIRANCSYNIFAGRAPSVSDLRVRFVVTPRSTDSVVHVRLAKLGRAFWATIRMDGTVSISESPVVPEVTSPAMVSKRIPRFVVGKSVKISFENVDYRLSLSVRGEEVLSSSDDADSPSYYGPDLAALRRQRSSPAIPPRVYGAGGGFELSHLVVHRDAYYYHPTARAFPLRWAPASGWGSATSPILLREHEYFMLGDNTAASQDSRLWDKYGSHLKERGEAFQLGTVPEDQLIGKAFFVYWPSGHRLDWLPVPGLRDLGIVPDVGRMRWIR